MRAKKSVPRLTLSRKRAWLTILQQSGEKLGSGSYNYQTILVVLDSNIWISAVLFGGNPEKIVRHAIVNHQVVTSDYIVGEVTEMISSVKPKLPHKWLRVFRQKLYELSKDDNFEVPDIIRDLKDEPVLKLAAKHNALLVTGDKDLLEHKTDSSTVILSTSEYAEIFDL